MYQDSVLTQRVLCTFKGRGMDGFLKSHNFPL